MKIISWNVNGIRAVHRRGDLQWLFDDDIDIFCFQETKAAISDIPEEIRSPSGYQAFHHVAERKGYSGVSTFAAAHIAVDEVQKGIGPTELSREGRLIRTSHPDFELINVYFPNGGRGEEHYAYKLRFYDEVTRQLGAFIDAGRQVVLCGDVNCAHRDIDIHDPERYAGHTGVTDKERAFIDGLLDMGFVDTFRAEHGDIESQYTWWDNRTFARKPNRGWRIDYFFITPELEEVMVDAWTSPHILGSDHCPIGLELDL